MTDEHRPTGLGWPELPGEPRPRQDTGAAATPVSEDPPDDTPADTPADTPSDTPGDAAVRPAGRRPSGAGLMIGLLLALLGFTIVVQLRNVSTDPTLAVARQEDLVRILSDLESREQRLRDDIRALEDSQRQLTSGVEGRKAAMEEATRRADALGILAGTLPARGPGLVVRFVGPPDAVKARAVLDAVQELRGAGAEAMQIAGSDGVAVRIVASSYFVDTATGIVVDGQPMTGPYALRVIGDPPTMRTALHIAGGVVESVAKDGGTVSDDEVAVVEVSAVRDPGAMQYARPVS